MVFRGVRQHGSFRVAAWACLPASAGQPPPARSQSWTAAHTEWTGRPYLISQIFSAAVDRAASGASSWPPSSCFPGGDIVERVVPAGITSLNMKIGSIINQQQGLLGFGAWGRCVGRFFCGLLGCSLFRLGSQVNTTLLADNLIMSVNVRNQLSGGLVDGLQTGPQLRQRLVLAPGGDIAKAVLASLDAVILADRRRRCSRPPPPRCCGSWQPVSPPSDLPPPPAATQTDFRPHSASHSSAAACSASASVAKSRR